MNVTAEQKPQVANQVEDAQEYISPEVNIFETKDGYVLEAEMAGVSKENLEIALEGNEMTITGNRRVEPFQGELHFRESRNLNFRRVFELDPAIDTAKITAKIDQGLLTLTLPKSEKSKPRTINVD